jgi:hypothetical protein
VLVNKAIEVLHCHPDGSWKLIVGDPNGRACLRWFHNAGRMPHRYALGLHSSALAATRLARQPDVHHRRR